MISAKSRGKSKSSSALAEDSLGSGVVEVNTSNMPLFSGYAQTPPLVHTDESTSQATSSYRNLSKSDLYHLKLAEKYLLQNTHTSARHGNTIKGKGTDLKLPPLNESFLLSQGIVFEGRREIVEYFYGKKQSSTARGRPKKDTSNELDKNIMHVNIKQRSESQSRSSGSTSKSKSKSKNKSKGGSSASGDIYAMVSDKESKMPVELSIAEDVLASASHDPNPYSRYNYLDFSSDMSSLGQLIGLEPVNRKYSSMVGATSEDNLGGSTHSQTSAMDLEGVHFLSTSSPHSSTGSLGGSCIDNVTEADMRNIGEVISSKTRFFSGSSVELVVNTLSSTNTTNSSDAMSTDKGRNMDSIEINTNKITGSGDQKEYKTLDVVLSSYNKDGGDSGLSSLSTTPQMETGSPCGSP